MIRVLMRQANGAMTETRSPQTMPIAPAAEGDLLWLDLSQEPLPQVEKILRDFFPFHPLAIDDALNESHVPKVDEWYEYLYIVLRSAYLEADGEPAVHAPELDIFLGQNFLITYASEKIGAIERVWALCGQDERWLERGPDFLLYRLADELAAEMVETADAMHDQLDELEEEIFSEQPPDTSEELFTLKRNVLRLRRVVLPQRDVLHKLSRNPYAVIDDDDRVFFRDVYDHLLRLNDLLDEMLILVGSALDTYLSVVNNRMNDIMKTLTIITALFMPLGFITGFFGMNFFTAAAPLGTWTGTLAFVIALAVMLLIPAAMFWYMRRQQWI
jgi:magnesium transporter